MHAGFNVGDVRLAVWPIGLNEIGYSACRTCRGRFSYEDLPLILEICRSPTPECLDADHMCVSARGPHLLMLISGPTDFMHGNKVDESFKKELHTFLKVVHEKIQYAHIGWE